jgi:hypothetical protein
MFLNFSGYIAHIIIENEHKQFGLLDILHFLMKASSNTCQKRVINKGIFVGLMPHMHLHPYIVSYIVDSP